MPLYNTVLFLCLFNKRQAMSTRDVVLGKFMAVSRYLSAVGRLLAAEQILCYCGAFGNCMMLAEIVK